MRAFDDANEVRMARWGTRFTLVWLTFTLALGGCESTADTIACERGADGGSDRTSVRVPITVVIARYRSAPGGDTTNAFGIDLDGRTGSGTGSCTDAMDFVSDITGAPGVDNQLALVAPIIDGLVGGDGWDGALEATVLSGVEAIALQITATDSDDACARRVHAWTVRIENAPVALDTQCPRDASCGRACFLRPSSNECVGIAASLAWRALDDLGEVDARLVGARLRTEPFARLPLLPTIAPLGTTAVLAPLDMHGVVIEADLAPTTLQRGQLGGAIAMSDFETWANAHVVGSTTIDDLWYRVFLQPDLAPDDHTEQCDDLSAGFGFETLTATLLP